MIATEFSTMHSVRLGDSTCGAADPADRDTCLTHGGEQHGYALIVLGLLTMLMTGGAVFGRSKPAAVALGVIGAVVLVIAFALDLPTLDDTRGFETRFTDVEAERGGAITLEIIAGSLALLACVLALLHERLRPKTRATRGPAPRAADDAPADSAA
jgi:hypothetical protein